MTGFFGESTYKVDDKGRVPLPTEYRDELQRGMFIVRWVEKSLRIYPLDEWEKIRSKISALPGNQKGRAYKRFIFGGANQTKMDKIGRVAIPASLRQYATIGDTVVIVGQDTYLELFSPQTLQEVALSEEEMFHIAEVLESEHPS